MTFKYFETARPLLGQTCCFDVPFFHTQWMHRNQITAYKKFIFWINTCAWFIKIKLHHAAPHNVLVLNQIMPLFAHQARTGKQIICWQKLKNNGSGFTCLDQGHFCVFLKNWVVKKKQLHLNKSLISFVSIKLQSTNFFLVFYGSPFKQCNPFSWQIFLVLSRTNTNRSTHVLYF